MALNDRDLLRELRILKTGRRSKVSAAVTEVRIRLAWEGGRREGRGIKSSRFRSALWPSSRKAPSRYPAPVPTRLRLKATGSSVARTIPGQQRRARGSDGVGLQRHSITSHINPWGGLDDGLIGATLSGERVFSL